MEKSKEKDTSIEKEPMKVTRSEFLKKAGKLALITGPALAVLFTSTRAKADSGTQDGS